MKPRNTAKKLTYTPGPWTVFILYGKDEGELAIVSGHKKKDEGFILAYMNKLQPNNEANADLIASAPDLLAACKYALDCEEDDKSKLARSLRAAIAKAEGDE